MEEDTYLYNILKESLELSRHATCRAPDPLHFFCFFLSSKHERARWFRWGKPPTSPPFCCHANPSSPVASFSLLPSPAFRLADLMHSLPPYSPREKKKRMIDHMEKDLTFQFVPFFLSLPLFFPSLGISIGWEAWNCWSGSLDKGREAWIGWEVLNTEAWIVARGALSLGFSSLFFA